LSSIVYNRGSGWQVVAKVSLMPSRVRIATGRRPVTMAVVVLCNVVSTCWQVVAEVPLKPSRVRIATGWRPVTMAVRFLDPPPQQRNQPNIRLAGRWWLRCP
jgi:hypothetical protein